MTTPAYIPALPGRPVERVGEPHEDGEVVFVTPRYDFCPLDGTPLVDRREAESTDIRRTCPACGFVAYHNPAPAVGGVILRDTGAGPDVLLVRRKYEPHKDGWSLPAGFMEFGERQVDALAREVKEETDLDMTSASLLCVEDGSEDPRTHALLIAFLVHEWSGDVVPGDDASEAGWFPLTNLPADMAWKAHSRALAKAVEVLAA